MPKVTRMSSVPILSLANYPSGTYGPFGPVDIADDVTSVDFLIQCFTAATPDIWPDVATTLDFWPQVSVDGGPFEDAGRSLMTGGPHAGKGGVGQISSIRCGGGLAAGINRRYQIKQLKIDNGPLRTSATVEVT